MEVAAVANKSKLAHTTTRKVRSLSKQLSYCQCRVACVVWLNRQLLTNSRVHALGASPKFTASQVHPHYRSKGGDKRPHRDTERNRHVHHQRRNGNTSPRSSRRPYSEIMAQKHDLPLDSSGDDYRYTDRLSDHGHKAPDSDSASDCPSDYGYPERYTPEPRVRRVRFVKN